MGRWRGARAAAGPPAEGALGVPAAGGPPGPTALIHSERDKWGQL